MKKFFMSTFMVAQIVSSNGAFAQDSLTKPAKPTVELLETVPVQAPVEPPVVVPEPPDSGNGTPPVQPPVQAGCPFPSVAERNQAVDSDIFGSVPRINGVLPANMPIGVPFDGPTPGTEYIRVSSDSGNGGHYYSTVQVWNTDMSKLMIGDGRIDANRLLDASNNYSLLSQRVNLTTDRLWSNVDPNIMYGISGGTTVYRVDVSTGVRTAIYSRPDGAGITFMGKQNIPDDDSKMVFLVRSQNRIVSIDLQSSAIPRPVLGEIDFTPWGNLAASGVMLSYEHSGRWVIARSRAGVMHRLPPDLSSVVVVGQMCCHADTAYNINGESVVAEVHRRGRVRVFNYDTLTQYDSPSLVNVTPGQSDHLFASYLSGRGNKNCGKGWVVLSGEEGNGSPNHPLVLYKLDGNTGTATFKIPGGDLHSGAPVTNTSANRGKQKAVHSPDGNSIIFDSDGGVRGGELSTYILRDKASK